MLATALFACGSTLTSATGGSSGGFATPISLGSMATYAIAASILGVGIIMLAAIVALARRSDPAPIPIPVPAGATRSPDGYYWWDGASWRPVR